MKVLCIHVSLILRLRGLNFPKAKKLVVVTHTFVHFKFYTEILIALH